MERTTPLQNSKYRIIIRFKQLSHYSNTNGNLTTHRGTWCARWSSSWNSEFTNPSQRRPDIFGCVVRNMFVKKWKKSLTWKPCQVILIHSFCEDWYLCFSCYQTLRFQRNEAKWSCASLTRPNVNAFNNFQSGTPRSRILLPATYPTPSLDQINCEKTLDCHSSNLSCKGTTKFSTQVGNTEIVYNQMAQLAITTSNLQLWSTKMSFCRLESTSLPKKTKRVLISNLSTIWRTNKRTLC